MTSLKLSPALLPIADAQARLFTLAERVTSETVSLGDAAGRWAATDITARRTQPSATLSAMDGYAIRFGDLPGPWRLTGESSAGHAFPGTINQGEAARIFTGASLPEGADTVLIQEEAQRQSDRLVLAGDGPSYLGRHTRARGLDFSAGDAIILAGDRLTPARIALAATAGHAMLAVNRRVRVALLATGDELLEPGAATCSGELPESNRAMLAAILADLPIEVIDLGITSDRLETLTAVFQHVEADILVTTGGASVGDHDLVRPALEAAGGTIDFWRIALKPGKPMLAGRLGGMVMLGLPGNPVSAYVTAMLFLKPLIAAMAGASAPLPRTFFAPLGEAIPANGPRTDYLRAALIDGQVTATTIQDSSMLRTLGRANCLIVRASFAPALDAGHHVEILPIS